MMSICEKYANRIFILFQIDSTILFQTYHLDRISELPR